MSEMNPYLTFGIGVSLGIHLEFLRKARSRCNITDLQFLGYQYFETSSRDLSRQIAVS